MTTSRRFALFAALGAVVILVLFACSKDSYPDALRAMLEKERLVDELRFNLLLATEAEKNAVLSATDAEAASFVDQARQAMGMVRDDLARLTALVQKGEESKEITALSAVTADFSELSTVGAAILRVAGLNTNLRASLLSRTQAAQAAGLFKKALEPIADGPDCQAAREALRAIAASLDILALHARHIEESTDTGMDTMEKTIDEQNSRALAALAALPGLLSPDAAATLVTAKTAYADFWRITQEILRLSRENSNINALALVMGRKRLLTAKSLDDLAALNTVVSAKEFKATR